MSCWQKRSSRVDLAAGRPPPGTRLTSCCMLPRQPLPTSQMTVSDVKSKLCFHCGTPPSAMRLQLKDPGGRVVAALEDEARKLGYYSPEGAAGEERSCAAVGLLSL